MILSKDLILHELIFHTCETSENSVHGVTRFLVNMVEYEGSRSIDSKYIKIPGNRNGFGTICL